MKQYNAVKGKYPGALLLFRVGDFYETFGEDAITTSRVLDIVLTKRANGSASEVELAGFPHHALDNYLTKLVRAGYRVAICDQLEDPKFAKGVVKRGVTELVTPGLSFNDNVLDRKRNNYLASLHFEKDKIGIALLDLSTGEFITSCGTVTYIEKLLQSFNPAEVIYCKKDRKVYEELFRDQYNTYRLEDWLFTHDYAYERLTKHFNTQSLKGFGVENLTEGIIAAGAVLYYLEETEHREIKHISSLARIEEEKYVWLDKFTIRNLELIFPQHEGGVPLIDVLDKTCTPMGARLLKKWIVLPLKSKTAIEERLHTVEALLEQEEMRKQIIQYLKTIGDLERLISKVAAGRINPREMIQLKRAIKHSIPVKQLLASLEIPQLKKLADQLHTCEYILDKIERELRDDPPLVTNQGGLIREGIHEELDELNKIAYSGKDYLEQVRQREIQNTGISSLKLSYNKVFGYYLEVSNAHKNKVPSDWIRKQTLVNAERYITEELKTYEEKILHAEEKLTHIEQKLYQDLVLATTEFVTQIQQNARTLAVVDCLSSFAQIAYQSHYTKPKLADDDVIDIKEGRHPVIEKQMTPGENYVPNDIYLDNEKQQIIIITGPNMAGKSALLRQTALIVLMAQMGSFVPAAHAQIGIVDKVFTRVGASDNLAKGESTFMVEMIETASIINNLSSRSLLLMDEIGRGTSTYDGISIAWSIVEYLHNHPRFQAKTLFATHYHELNQLSSNFARIKNYNVAVKEVGNKILFLRKLKEGGSEHSFGIHVAQMAGMPQQVVMRANEIMHHLEKDKINGKGTQQMKDIPKQQNFQLSLFDADPKFIKIKEMLEKTDINTVSPVEALLKLNELQLIMKS
ncbi:DNA mismatch repair protein MutS [Catalinimonas alkaloidigena]|uniref:DNA mismatch repair protein MutS n=1 Tax=Catalinimonas alkaloidigena TaxID=1075417 RepID=UPI0024055981|nr:DNA mismatch repair protein MutS [Catalinimonas alkaloidigena]